MPKSVLAGVDLKIAQFYAPYVLGSLKYGENRLCTWFPGSGKTNAISDLFSSSHILKTHLKNLYPRLVFVHFSAIDSDLGLANEILQRLIYKLDPKSPNSLVSNPSQKIVDICQQIIDQGKEVVFVGNEIESLDQTEYQKLVNSLARIVLCQKSRIHSILNLKNKDRFNLALSKNNSLFTLANSQVHIPLLRGNLLDELLEKIIANYHRDIPASAYIDISQKTGGVLTLTKELLRNYPEPGELDLKFNDCLKHLSTEYKKVFQLLIEKHHRLPVIYRKAKKELENIGALHLTIFRQKYSYFGSNPKTTLKKLINPVEQKILQLFDKNQGKLVTRDQLINTLSDPTREYSDWAIDQIISRFRKKMSLSGIDPSDLTTVKGKGYKW